MTFPILGGNGAVAGYSIDNSLRLNQGDTPHLDKTFSSAGTSNKIGTLSFWYKRTTVGNVEFLFHVYPNRSGHSNDRTFVAIGSDNKLVYERIFEGSTQSQIKTTQLFRDVSAWYHFTIVFDTTQSTASDRLKIYLNGNQITDFSTTNYPAQNLDIDLADAHLHTVGAGYNGSYIHPTDGYLAEYHYIDGQALSPTDFGEFDTDSGIWKPIEYTGSYGTNGFYLDFENSGSLGTDQSGNGNDFSATNLASTDQTTDTPTNNFATANYLTARYGASDIKEGNLILDAGGDIIANSTQGFSSGKWYVEIKSTITAGHGNRKWVGIISGDSDYRNPRNVSSSSPYTGVGVNLRTGDVYRNATELSLNINTFADGDIASLFYDADNGYLYVAKNGTLENSGNPVNNGSPLDTSLIYNFHFNQDGGGSNNGELYLNFGNAPTGYTISSGNADANGYGNFEYNPVISSTNYLALCTQNLATELSPTIDDGSQYFNTILYTGDGNNSRTVTGTGFQPDWVWVKVRNTGYGHKLFDSSRGTGKRLSSQSTDAESTVTDELTSFDSDGFTTNNNAGMNENTRPYVAWQWLANGGTTSSNTDGSITSTVQANTTAGFSIVTYTGTGANATVGHGLGVAPKVVIIKNRSSAASWMTYHEGVDASNPADFYLFLNDTTARVDDATAFQDTEPTSTVFSIGNGSTQNQSGANILAYCFAEIEGYSKFGKYTGNGNADGTFVYTGFRPAFVLLKRTDTTQHWSLFDSKRNGFNIDNDFIYPNLANAEASVEWIDIVSNGFKLRTTDSQVNTSGSTQIYMAFAENPFATSSGVPVVAR